MNKEYRIECEECDNVSVVLTEIAEEPVFCPMCGRRADCDELAGDDENWDDDED